MRHCQFHVKNSRNNIEAQRLKVELAISANPVPPGVSAWRE